MNVFGSKKEAEPPAQTPEEVQQAEEDKKAAEEGGKVKRMRRGDYMVHVLVESAKNIKYNGVCDPIVEISVLGKKEFTTAQKGITNMSVADWNEHIFYEFKNQEPSELESGKIEIKLKDQGIFKDALIGYYEFDLNYIYLMPNHALMHKWIVMSNPESDTFGEVTGYLKLSITVAGVEDEMVQIEDDPHPEKESIIQPPSIKPDFFQLQLRFFRAEKIVPMDTSLIGKRSVDAYIKLDYKTSKLKTRPLTQVENGSIDINQEFLVPAQLPIMGGRMFFQVYDEDTVKDELIGSFWLDQKDFISGGKAANDGMNKKFFWKNIYGAPLGCSGANSTKMNEDPEKASLWKGRILMQVTATSTQKPILKVQDIIHTVPDEKDKSKKIDKTKEFLDDIYSQYGKNNLFEVRVNVNSAIGLPAQGEKFQVEVRVAEESILTGDPTSFKGSYNRYLFKPEKPIQLRMPYVNVGDIGYVFIYLLKSSKLTGTKRVCFTKIHSKDLVTEDPEISWLELQPDLAIGEITDHYKAGLLSFKMTIKPVSEFDRFDWRSLPGWASKLGKRPPIFKVRAYIFQARDLPAADSNGTSDPFVVFTDTTENVVKTKTIYESSNPIWYEAVEMAYECEKIQDMPPFVIDIYDEDKNVVSKNSADFLARALIFPNQLKEGEDYVFQDKDTKDKRCDVILKPKWYPVRYDSNSPTCGEILMTFAICSDFDYKFERSLEKLHLHEQVIMREYDVNLQILGLRNLQSPGLLPIKKAFITFNLKSMVPPALGSNLQNIKTEPKAAGPNPTLNTLMSFNMPLPKEELYCPRLSCSVYDCIFSGFNQPLVGTFVIPIGDIMIALKQERVEEIQALREAVDELEKIVHNPESLRDTMQQKQYQAQLDNAVLSKQQTQLKKEADKFAGKLSGVSDSMMSLNPDSDEEREPLLTGDFDEESRMKDRLNEKSLNATQGSQNIAEELKRSQKSLLSSSNAKDIMKQNRGLEMAAGVAKQVILQAQKEENEKAERDQKDEQNREWPEWKNMMTIKYADEFQPQADIYMARYEMNTIFNVLEEKDKPPAVMFVAVGFDKSPQDFQGTSIKDLTLRQKHYRKFYNTELEKVKEVMKVASPFQTYNLKRGQSRGASAGMMSSLFGTAKKDASGQVSSEQVVGVFKAIIQVESQVKRKIYEENKRQIIEKMSSLLCELAEKKGIQDFSVDLKRLETPEGREWMKNMNSRLGVRYLCLTQKLADLESDVILQRLLMRKTKTCVRVYIISGFNFASRDIGGESDPYIKVSVGEHVQFNREEYQIDQPCPDFYKSYDFEAYFPGCPPLIIDAMDYDLLFGDELIGSTVLDLEDRYFNLEWKSILNKPIETRNLYHPSSQMSQGKIKMWLEINDVTGAVKPKLWDITPEPKQPVEVRVCIFDTKEVIMMDAEGTSDVFIRSYFDSKKALETDTHYRCQTGEASFNYRLLYREDNPRKNSVFTVQCYDRDFFKSNDIIGQGTIDLKKVFEHVKLTNRPVILSKKYYEEVLVKEGMKLEFKDDETFWIPMENKNDDGKVVINGYVRVQIEICPAEHADANRVGSAREDPNHSPFLEPPKGRLSFSLNPWKMFTQLVGPAMRRKIYFYCCLIFCLVLCIYICIMMVPVIFANYVTKIFS